MNAEDVTRTVKMDFKTLLMGYFLSICNQNTKKCQLGIAARRLLFSHVPFIFNFRVGLNEARTAIDGSGEPTSCEKATGNPRRRNAK